MRAVNQVRMNYIRLQDDFSSSFEMKNHLDGVVLRYLYLIFGMTSSSLPL